MTLRTEEEALAPEIVCPQMDGGCRGSKCMAFRWALDFIMPIGSGSRIVILDQKDQDVSAEAWWWDGRYIKGNGNRYLHREIAERALGAIPEGMFVDHIDGDPLNNRRGNLRVVTKAQNAANAAPRGGRSKYRGVFQQPSGRWTAQISKAGVRLCLGTYDTEEEAASAYDEAAKTVHGEFARLNLETIENSGRRGYCGLAGKPTA